MSERDQIPREFYSEYTELPFVRCIDCDCALFADETVYTVVKHIVGKETVFEMAICMECAARMRQQYSEETTQNLQAYIEQKLREKLQRRLDTPDWEESQFSYENGLSACAFCEKKRSDCHRYEMVAIFVEEDLILESGQGLNFSSPMMLCEDCNSEVAQLVSKKTRDSWDRFVEEHFDGPPGIEVDGPKLEPVLF